MAKQKQKMSELVILMGLSLHIVNDVQFIRRMAKTWLPKSTTSGKKIIHDMLKLNDADIADTIRHASSAYLHDVARDQQDRSKNLIRPTALPIPN